MDRIIVTRSEEFAHTTKRAHDRIEVEDAAVAVLGYVFGVEVGNSRISGLFHDM